MVKRIAFGLVPLGVLAVSFLPWDEYLRHGWQWENNFKQSIVQDSKEVILGFWDVPERILVARKFKKGYFLVQRDPGGSYMVGRGKNLLSDPRTVIQNKQFALQSLLSDNSELGGLYAPKNFPAEEMPALGYQLNGDGEWIRKDLSKVSEVKADLKGILSYSLPKSKNTTDWAQFPNLTLPKGIYNVGGYGFPLYRDEQLQGGKLILLSKGFTHLVNLNALPRATWEGKNVYYFNQLYYLMIVAARSMVNDGKTGAQYGNIQAIANLANDNTQIPYEGLTVQGAKELGKHIFKTSCCSNSIDDPNYNILKSESVLMLDEESMSPRKWAGGDHYSLLGYLNQGIMEEAGPGLKVFWYAQPVQQWFNAQVARGLDALTEREVEGAFNDRNILMSTPGWKNSTWYVDASGAYSKVPFLSNAEIYQKKNGKIVSDAQGKRMYRTDDFQLKVYNRTFTILGTPHENIRYALQNSNTGEQVFGKKYVDIARDGSASIKKEYSRKGFGWFQNGLARPNPKYWEGEAKMWVDGIYRRADGIMLDLLMLAKLEKGRWDISKANSRFMLYGEHRPQTEPWTFGGNAVDVREVGESQIFYDTFMLLLSGGQALSSWDDGFYRNELPNKGQKLYDKDDYWGRYHSKLAAVQTVMKPLEGSNRQDWTYIHFYYPFVGQKNAEVISSGIYHKGRLQVFFLNPTLEKGERQVLTLKAGTKTYTVELLGHEVEYKQFDVPTGLKPKDFKLEYTTIYGRKVKVNGLVNNRITDHYE
jgi:hypothetical protein